MTESWAETTLERLRAASGRSGGARRAVVEFMGRQACCLSAQEIHDGLRAGGARVGVASVYRVLDSLDQLGLVQRVDLGDGISRFEPTLGGGEHHHHLVCEDCGKVEPFEDEGLETTLARVAGSLGYAAGTHEVVLRGACTECRPR
jgi:Fur family ferric uptake transcriptional regulator